MQPVFFDTPGTLDLRATTTFGLSAKEGENPIGFFGTGLKYAIAIIMRHRGNLTIVTEEKTHHFDVKTTDFRGQEFDAIILDGKEMPFTTHLGANWKMWMAYRELYCNTKDEKGITHSDMKRYLPEGWTRISVMQPEFHSCYRNRHEYFIEDEQPLYTHENIEIYTGPCEHLFYKGVRSHTTQYKQLYRYNYIGSMELTEDRTMTCPWIVERRIPKAITNCDDAHIIQKVILAPDYTFEAYFHFDKGDGPVSSAFMEVMKSLKHDKSGRVNKSAQDLYRHLTKKPGEHDYDEVELSPIQQKVFNKSLQVCRDLGYDPDDKEILCVKSLGNGMLGCVEDSKIFIAMDTFEQGTKMVAGTLMEELMHIHHGVSDCSRNMQNMLINRIMTMYEDKTGEPL